jgi:hypothetical protein
MIMALLRAKLDAQKVPGGLDPAQSGGFEAGANLRASEALLKSLRKAKPR